MKNPTFRRKDGFTLVELLVVITIIAVLAGAGFAAGNAAIQKAKKATALQAATSIKTSVDSFFSEYGSMPLAGTTPTSDETVDTKTDLTNFLNPLLGLEGTGANIINSRGIKFLNAKEGKAKGTGGTGGIIYDSTGNTVRGLFDPWGGPYYVILDMDYDEQVAPKTAAGTTKNLNGVRSAVWTNGADNTTGTGGKIADDVMTWQP